MNHTISLNIATGTFLELMDYLRDYGDQRDPSEVATAAIEAWLAIAKGEATSRCGAHGYQWKELFLPEGTVVRMPCGSTFAYAHVVGDLLLYKGVATTPSRFVALIAGSRRNAWRDLWVRLPGAAQWKKAGFHRLDQKPRPERGVVSLDNRPSTSAVMANSLKNALALVEKAAGHRHGQLTRRTDVHPDD